jgi:hypothetical protein
MSEDNKDKPNNVVELDESRIKRLTTKGHYVSMLEQFDILRIKFLYDQLEKEEAIKFITLCKYFMRYGHNESIRLNCHYIYKKYIEGQGI